MPAQVLGDSSFYDPALADSLSELERNPLWSTLPAVKAGRVVQIPGPIYNGGNYYAGGSKMTPQLLGRPTIVDDLPRREFIVDDPSGLISQVSNDLGLTPFKLVAKTPADHTKLSLEELGQLEGVDYIMFAEYPSEKSLERETQRSGLVYSNPLWQNLSAVRGDRVVGYPGELYYVSPLTAIALADLIGKELSP